MAETGQRFTLHARSWNIPRIIGYPAGLRWNRESLTRDWRDSPGCGPENRASAWS